ncbi:MAG: hypothetical protein AAF788_01650 [Pseudomonadota bacterium]
MKKAIVFLAATTICGGGGFALGEIIKQSSSTRAAGTAETQQSVIFSAGQFTIPMFEGGRVPYFLLTEINLEVQTYDEVSLLSSNKPQVRATVLETLFELERRGEIKPDTIEPDIIKSAIKADLETTFDINQISNVLLDRLLIQETGGRR